MEEDGKRNSDETRESQELHHANLDRPRQLSDDDKGTKTFHMAPRQEELGWPEGVGRDKWPVYDPFTGLRTAAVLGGLMLLMLVYILYKTRCGGRFGRRRWTSKDRLFVERYKRKVQERYTLDGSMRRRRDTARTTTSRNMDGRATAADRQTTTVTGAADRRLADNDVDRRRRHHSVNEAMTHLDVSVPLRVGTDAARSVPGPSTSTGGGDLPNAGREKQPPPTPVTVQVRDSLATPAAGADCDDRPPLTRFVPRRTAARRSTFVDVDLRRLGRRCHSLDNVHHTLSPADDRRTHALLMAEN